MGTAQSAEKISFEDMQFVIKNINNYLLLNTLSQSEQNCLINGTLLAHQEEETINKLLSNRTRKIKIVIYGRNCNDEKIYKKYHQLFSLGFTNIYMYVGGMFEWLLLQDIYGPEEFPTTSKQLDIIKFKPQKTLGLPLLEY